MRGDTAHLPPIPRVERVEDCSVQEVHRCVACGGHWQLDLKDRLQVMLAIKVSGLANGPIDEEPVRRQFRVD